MYPGNSDYRPYIRNNERHRPDEYEEQNSNGEVNIFKIFIISFIIIFIIIVAAIVKYSTQMDMEYAKAELSKNNVKPVNSISGYENYGEEEHKKIDKRLALIQQEENAPSEAKIIQDKNRPKEADIIDPIHIEESQKIDKIEKQKLQNNNDILEKPPMPGADVKQNTQTPAPETAAEEKNITVMSKVLVGRFSTFEEAKEIQSSIKKQDSSLSPYVKKIGSIYSVQIGSYQDFSVARTQAQILKSKGFDVWIYQQ